MDENRIWVDYLVRNSLVLGLVNCNPLVVSKLGMIRFGIVMGKAYKKNVQADFTQTCTSTLNKERAVFTRKAN